MCVWKKKNLSALSEKHLGGAGRSLHKGHGEKNRVSGDWAAHGGTSLGTPGPIRLASCPAGGAGCQAQGLL